MPRSLVDVATMLAFLLPFARSSLFIFLYVRQSISVASGDNDLRISRRSSSVANGYRFYGGWSSKHAYVQRAFKFLGGPARWLVHGKPSRCRYETSGYLFPCYMGALSSA